MLASSIKGEFVALNLEPILLPDGGGQRWIHRNPMQVDHCAAGGANKVTMRGRNSVKALLSVDHTNALDGPVLLKEQQVSVHGPQAEIRMGAFQCCLLYTSPSPRD